MAALREHGGEAGLRFETRCGEANGKAARRGSRSETCTVPTEPTPHGALAVMQPTRCGISRKENGHDVRGDHSQNHCETHEQHLYSLESNNTGWNGFKRS